MKYILLISLPIIIAGCHHPLVTFPNGELYSTDADVGGSGNCKLIKDMEICELGGGKYSYRTDTGERGFAYKDDTTGNFVLHHSDGKFSPVQVVEYTALSFPIFTAFYIIYNAVKTMFRSDKQAQKMPKAGESNKVNDSDNCHIRYKQYSYYHNCYTH